MRKRNMEDACTYLAADHGVDLRPKVSANEDLHAQVGSHLRNLDVSCRKYSSALYTPADWHHANATLAAATTNAQNSALVVDKESRQCMRECACASDNRQKQSTRLLKERAQLVRSVQSDLAKVSWVCREEEEQLEGQRQRALRSLAALTRPTLVNAECLERRRNRLERDLVADDLHHQLNQETEAIEEARRCISEAASEAATRLAGLRKAREQVERDWAAKQRAATLETQCIGLKIGRLCPAATHPPFQQVEVESWSSASDQTIGEAESQVAASTELRSRIDEALTAAARRLRTQADAVDDALERRVAQVEHSRVALENQIDQVVRGVVEMERLQTDLRRAGFNNGLPLRVAQQRLQTRKARPQPAENCTDLPQSGLLAEVAGSEGAAQQLEAAEAAAEARLAELLR
ncbi:Hypothetical predicted protein, partial [Cloeon dipterum]